MTPEPDPAVDDDPRIRCYACAELVHPDARKCRWCGEWYADLRHRLNRHADDVTAQGAIARYAGSAVPVSAGVPSADDLAQASVAAPLEFAIGHGVDPTDLTEIFELGRRDVAAGWGVIVPPIVKIADPALDPGAWELRIHGEPRGHGNDLSTLTHGEIHDVLVSELPSLLSREAVALLIGQARETSLATVEDLVPNQLSIGELAAVLRRLVADGIRIRHLQPILDALADAAGNTRDPDALAERVRAALAPTLFRPHVDEAGVLRAVVFSDATVAALSSSVQFSDTGQHLTLNDGTRRALVQNMQRAASSDGARVLLVPAKVRRYVADVARGILPVMAREHVPWEIAVEVVEELDLDVFAPPAAPGSDWLIEV